MANATQEVVALAIPAPDFGEMVVPIVGTAPLVINKMTARARQKMRDAQEEGSRAKSKKVREPRDFSRDCIEAAHISEEGWHGIHAAAFRSAMIRACSVVGYKMTQAKMSVFVQPDGLDAETGEPLVRINGEYEEHIAAVKNDNGSADLRARPMYRRWGASVRVRWDRSQFSERDVVNLLSRAGQQVGVGAGRPFSSDSAGCGWGTFEVVSG